MRIRQLTVLQHSNNDDLGCKTSTELFDEKYILRFRWLVTPKRNKLMVDVLLLDGAWRNIIVILDNETSRRYEFFDDYNTVHSVWSDETNSLSKKIHEEIENLKTKKWL